MRCAKGGDGWGNERSDCRGGGPNFQCPGKSARLIAQAHEREIDGIKQRRGLLQEIQPERGWLGRPTAPVEKCASCDFFDLPYGFRQGRRHHANPLSRACKASFCPNRMDRPQMPQVKIRIF